MRLLFDRVDCKSLEGYGPDPRRGVREFRLKELLLDRRPAELWVRPGLQAQEVTLNRILHADLNRGAKTLKNSPSNSNSSSTVLQKRVTNWRTDET